MRPADAAILDIFAHGERFYAVAADGAVVVCAVDGRALHRLASPGHLAPCRLVAARGDEVVLWGWECVERRCVVSGARRWAYDDGDHSLDEIEGSCAVFEDWALLPNGAIMSLEDGAFVWGEGAEAFYQASDGGSFAATARGLVAVGRDGVIRRWHPRAGFEVVERPSARPLAVAGWGAQLWVADADGSLRVLGEPTSFASARAQHPVGEAQLVVAAEHVVLYEVARPVMVREPQVRVSVWSRRSKAALETRSWAGAYVLPPPGSHPFVVRDGRLEVVGAPGGGLEVGGGVTAAPVTAARVVVGRVDGRLEVIER